MIQLDDTDAQSLLKISEGLGELVSRIRMHLIGAQAPPPPPPPPPSGNTITKDGITWTFDRAVSSVLSNSGDPLIVDGPIKVIAIDPPSQIYDWHYLTSPSSKGDATSGSAVLKNIPLINITGLSVGTKIVAIGAGSGGSDLSTTVASQPPITTCDSTIGSNILTNVGSLAELAVGNDIMVYGAGDVYGNTLGYGAYPTYAIATIVSFPTSNQIQISINAGKTTVGSALVLRNKLRIAMATNALTSTVQAGIKLVTSSWINGTVLNFKSKPLSNPADPLNLYAQGYDERAKYYVHSLNVGDISTKGPIQLNPGDSLISSISYTPTPVLPGELNTRPDVAGSTVQLTNDHLKATSVLTCLAANPPANPYRVPFVWDPALGAKPQFSRANLNLSVLPNLAAKDGRLYLPIVGNNPSYPEGRTACASYATMITRPWTSLIHRDLNGSFNAPTDNQVSYYAYVDQMTSDIMFLLCSDETGAGKNALIDAVVQRGIDDYGIITDLNRSQGNGARELSRIYCYVAGCLLNNAAMKSITLWCGFANNADGSFKDDYQVYRADAGQPGWTGATVLWRYKNLPGAKYEHAPPEQWDTVGILIPSSPPGPGGCYEESYRVENGATARKVGAAFAILKITGLRTAWNSARDPVDADVLIDYVDRTLAEAVDAGYDARKARIDTQCNRVNNTCPVQQRGGSGVFCANVPGSGGFLGPQAVKGNATNGSDTLTNIPVKSGYASWAIQLATLYGIQAGGPIAVAGGASGGGTFTSTVLSVATSGQIRMNAPATRTVAQTRISWALNFSQEMWLAYR